jgi:NAD(P)H-flavin reductase
MTDPASFRSRLVRSEVVAEGTMAFHFLKPDGFEFRPGQSIDVTLIDPPETDGEGNTRAFSIASAPFESDLMVATRMRDTAFKRVLGKASAGLDIKMDGPSGSLVLRRKADRRFAASSVRRHVRKLRTSCGFSIPTGDPRMPRFWIFLSSAQETIRDSISLPR